MLRLIHNQTIQGSILIDDIDDGLPNKLTHRLGSTADPKAYKRDGYANEPKQPVYLPRVDAATSLAGYIDLNETERVLLSAGSGKIAKLQEAGLITVVSLVAADLSAPTITAAEIDLPAAGDLQIDGTSLLSTSPFETSVRAFGGGVGDVTLTATQIIAVSPGAVSNTQIIIDTTLLPGLVAGDEVTVTADGQTTAAFTIVT